MTTGQSKAWRSTRSSFLGRHSPRWIRNGPSLIAPHPCCDDLGLRDTWYYDCPAFVLLGSRSCASMSGRTYRPAEEAVGEHNLVTVDLSPRRDEIWGDCARSFCIEGGRWVVAPTDTDLADGLAVENAMPRIAGRFDHYYACTAGRPAP